jgi:hypothetical protein
VLFIGYRDREVLKETMLIIAQNHETDNLKFILAAF